MPTTIPFRTNAVATAARIADVLEPRGYTVTGTWDHQRRKAVHITLAGRPMGSGLFVADGQQLVIDDNGGLRVEEVGRAR